jgi:hypothetical protein
LTFCPTPCGSGSTLTTPMWQPDPNFLTWWHFDVPFVPVRQQFVIWIVLGLECSWVVRVDRQIKCIGKISA